MQHIPKCSGDSSQFCRIHYTGQALIGQGASALQGVAEVGRRRRWQEGEERRMGKEQRAHHLSLLLGRAVYRRGDLELA